MNENEEEEKEEEDKPGPGRTWRIDSAELEGCVDYYILRGSCAEEQPGFIFSPQPNIITSESILN